MDSRELRSLQEAYLEVYQVDESSIANRARNAVADQRLSAAQSSAETSLNRLRNVPTVTRGTAALAARGVEKDVKTSSNYGPQPPRPGTVTGQKIEKPKPTGSKPKGFRLGGSSSLSGVGGSGATGRYQVGGSGGFGISGIRLADHYDVYDIILSHLLDEGYANTEEAAHKIIMNMSEEWTESILEMNDFAAGGGAAKMKETGMTKDQVVALGKKNIAAKPTSSSSSSSGQTTGSTPSDVVRDRLASTKEYRKGLFRIPSKAERIESGKRQGNEFDRWKREQDKTGYYKPGYKELPGTFEKG